MPGQVKDERPAMPGDREHIKLMSLIGGYLHSELQRVPETSVITARSGMRCQPGCCLMLRCPVADCELAQVQMLRVTPND